ncbi:MAG: hypothetical protein WCV92_05305 [Candidatus Buchananbacteria bacterium]
MRKIFFCVGGLTVVLLLFSTVFVIMAWQAREKVNVSRSTFLSTLLLSSYGRLHEIEIKEKGNMFLQNATSRIEDTDEVLLHMMKKQTIDDQLRNISELKNYTLGRIVITKSSKNEIEIYLFVVFSANGKLSPEIREFIKNFNDISPDSQKNRLIELSNKMKSDVVQVYMSANIIKSML